MQRLSVGLMWVVVWLVPGYSWAAPAAERFIAEAAYQDKVRAAWLGQIIGNIYGLSYEFQFIDEPGPDVFPYGFGPSLDKVRAADGAFSDDDTDIEYMYLLQMERHGVEPTYAQLAAAWQHHVRDKVWVANRQAVALMHAGFSPPLTGQKARNPHWYQIDPQLVNEIWAVTAPGMLDYATAKSAWAARITNDDFGIEPTVHYAAMYAAAFFESDLERLIDIGTAALPADGRFAAIVRHMQQLHRQYPDDWRAARREMARHYYGEFDYNRGGWAVVDANLNGACGILALLYGAGDVQRTLDIASGLGFDADNQAATMLGLLGIVKGTVGLPSDLLYPLGERRWQQPFNDRYINVSRHDLPDASLSDIAARTARLGERLILAKGGKKVVRDGVAGYLVPVAAQFTAPLELPTAPLLNAPAGQPFALNLAGDPAWQWQLDGDLPAGLTFAAGRIAGTPTAPGLYAFSVRVSQAQQQRRQNYQIRVNGTNLALQAAAAETNATEPVQLLQAMRDGALVTYFNRSQGGQPKTDSFGYRWSTPVQVSRLVLNPGMPEEFGGWYTDLAVQFQDARGQWRPVTGLSISPALDLDNSQWLKGANIDHTLTFAPVRTRALRVQVGAGGVRQDARNGGATHYFSGIAELAVYHH